MASKNRPVPAVPAPTPVWPTLFCLALCVWTAFILWAFNEKSAVNPNAALQFLDDVLSHLSFRVLKVLGLYGKAVVLTGMTVAAASTWGEFLLPEDTSGRSTRLERFCLSLAAGYLVLGLLINGLGYIGGYRPIVFFGFLAVAGAGGCYLQRRRIEKGLRAVNEWPWRPVLSSPAHLLLVFCIFTILLICFVPELFYDSMVYHLGLPQLYVNEGRWVDTPFVYFSRFPMFMHMLYVLALGVDGDILAKLLNASVLFMGLGGIFALCRRWGAPRGGLWAALWVLLIPVVQMNNWSTAIDSAMASFFVMAVLAFTIWRDQPVPSQPWLVWTGLLAGCVWGIKYTGATAVFAIGTAVTFLRSGRSWGACLRDGFLFSVLVLAMMTPWFARNFICTGNPVYPALPTVFESRNIHREKMEGETNIIKGYTPHSLGEVLTLPWTLTLREVSSFTFIGPLALSTLPLLVLVFWKRDDAFRGGALIAGAYFAVTLCITREIRYLLPGFFLLSAFIGIGLNVARSEAKMSGRVLAGCYGLVGVYHLLWILQVMQMAYRPAAVLLGDEPRLAYTTYYHNGLNPWPWEAIEPALEKLPPSAKLYVMGDEKVFRLPRRYVYSSVHDHTPLVLWADASRSGDDLYAILHREGITHLLFNFPEAMRLKDYRLFPWTPQGRQVFLDFSRRHLRLAASAPETGLKAIFLLEVIEKLQPSDPPLDFKTPFGDALNLHDKPAY